MRWRFLPSLQPRRCCGTHPAASAHFIGQSFSVSLFVVVVLPLPVVGGVLQMVPAA